MITVEDFKKLLKFQKASYQVRCDGDEVSLFYWPEDETEEDETEEERCTFTFNDDKYSVVCYLSDPDYDNAKWAVERVEQVDWRTHEITESS